jgi:hypothetical protein
MAILGKETPDQHWEIAVCQHAAARQIGHIAARVMSEASQEQAAPTIESEHSQPRPHSGAVPTGRDPYPTQHHGCSMSSSEAKQQGL